MIQTQRFISFRNTYLFQKDNTSKQSLVVYCDILSDMHVINVFLLQTITHIQATNYFTRHYSCRHFLNTKFPGGSKQETLNIIFCDNRIFILAIWAQKISQEIDFLDTFCWECSSLSTLCFHLICFSLLIFSHRFDTSCACTNPTS